MNSLIRVENVTKKFKSGSKEIQVLKGVNLSIPQFSLAALRGRSGSGKTTLLNIMGTLDRPTDGGIYFQDKPIGDYSDKQNSEFRRVNIGFIFQSYGIVPIMTVKENIEFGLRVAGVNRSLWKTRLQESIELVGLTKRVHHYPYELSGGEQQRVAIARAIAPKPPLILADEPTSELDSKRAFHIIQAFQKLTSDKETTIILTTHDPNILEVLDHVFVMEDGYVVPEKHKEMEMQ